MNINIAEPEGAILADKLRAVTTKAIIRSMNDDPSSGEYKLLMDIVEQMEKAAERGKIFCCLTNMGAVSRSVIRVLELQGIKCSYNGYQSAINTEYGEYTYTFSWEKTQ